MQSYNVQLILILPINNKRINIVTGNEVALRVLIKPKVTSKLVCREELRVLVERNILTFTEFQGTQEMSTVMSVLETDHLLHTLTLIWLWWYQNHHTLV